jgi:hypothetical protein
MKGVTDNLTVRKSVQTDSYREKGIGRVSGCNGTKLHGNGNQISGGTAFSIFNNSCLKCKVSKIRGRIAGPRETIERGGPC